jgi:aminopeptidase-like protein
MSDGRHDLVSIAEKSQIEWPRLVEAADRLEAVGLARTVALTEENQRQGS